MVNKSKNAANKNQDVRLQNILITSQLQHFFDVFFENQNTSWITSIFSDK